MSSAKEQKPAPMPTADVAFCNTFQFQIADGVLTIVGGYNGLQRGIAMPIGLAVDLHQKLGLVLADVIRQQAVPPAEAKH